MPHATPHEMTQAISRGTLTDMRLLGIDYGRKRVGLALSDETNTIATPLSVLQNSNELVEQVHALALEHHVGAFVLGASRNYQGKANPIMKDIEMFERSLQKKTGFPVYLESEVLTSVQARRHETKRLLRDASAAALILQSYLDRLQKT